jgi:acetyltransferase-like isoleucine patch superfamily enzyme
MRSIARALVRTRKRIRFRLWVARLRFELRRHGARLVLEAPHGAEFDGPPAIKVFPDGDGSAVTTLRIGRDVRLGRDMTLEVFGRGTNLLAIGDVARFMNGVRIALRAGAIEIGSDALVRDGAWLKSDGRLVVGDTVVVGPRTSLHCTEAISIGDRVGIAENVSILDSDHIVDGSDEHYRDRPVRSTPVALEANVLISAGVVILRGATIRRNSVVGANAVVRRGEYPAGSVIAGNPAAVSKTLPHAQEPRSADPVESA